MQVARNARTRWTRSRTQRMAVGSVTGSVRNWSAACSMLPARVAVRTTRSTSAKVPGRCAASPSGSRLTVRRVCGHRNRRTRTPSGVLRA